jgi:hypothetical protein
LLVQAESKSLFAVLLKKSDLPSGIHGNTLDKETPYGNLFASSTEIDPIIDFGYLTITSDGNTLDITFKTTDQTGVKEMDSVSVDQAHGTIFSGSSNAKKSGLKKSRTKTKSTKSKKSRR